MRRKSILAGLLTTLLLAAPAWAQHWRQGAQNSAPQSTAKPNSNGLTNYSGAFMLTETNAFSGACGQLYSSVCGSGTCNCIEFEGSGKGTFGKTVTSADA